MVFLATWPLDANVQAQLEEDDSVSQKVMKLKNRFHQMAIKSEADGHVLHLGCPCFPFGHNNPGHILLSTWGPSHPVRDRKSDLSYFRSKSQRKVLAPRRRVLFKDAMGRSINGHTPNGWSVRENPI